MSKCKTFEERIKDLVEQIKVLCEAEGYEFERPWSLPDGGLPAGTQVSMSISHWEPSRDWQDSSC